VTDCVIGDPALHDAVRRGDQRIVARTITAIEHGDHTSRDLLATEEFIASPTHLIGLTGAPGVGKSTAIAELVRLWRTAGLTVAVIAVDPTSQRTGGAVLGDRARMGLHAQDPGVFIRSMAARGHLGGLSRAVPQTVQALMIAGYDRVVVETVGVGQSEIEVASVVDTTCLLLAPGMGDALQAIKAGVMEIGDVLVVTKSDLAGADDVARGLRMAIGSGLTDDRWRVPIMRTSAVGNDGFPDVVDALDSHWVHMHDHGLRREKLVGRARHAILDGVLERLRREVSGAVLQELVTEYVQGDMTLDGAVSRLVTDLRTAPVI
jgi:LAO/AO transport system kinase